MECHDDVIKWKHFPRNWPFVRGIHRSPVNSPHKGQWRGALMFSLICVRNNNREAGDLRRQRGHYDVIVMVHIIHIHMHIHIHIHWSGWDTFWLIEIRSRQDRLFSNRKRVLLSVHGWYFVCYFPQQSRFLRTGGSGGSPKPLTPHHAVCSCYKTRYRRMAHVGTW